MLKHLFCGSLIAAVIVAAPSRSEAQAPSFQITPYAGYLTSGAVMNGPVGTAIRTGGAPIYGAEAALGLSRGLFLVGNVAYAKPQLELGAPVIGGLNAGETSVLMYDAGLRLNLPLALPVISPFVQGGVGQMRRTIEVGPVSSHATSLAYNIGGGVDFQLAPRLGLQLLAKDYIGKFDAKEATAIDLDTKTTHNWALSAGLRLGF